MVELGSVMEKRKPSHDLAMIKKQFVSVRGLSITSTALRDAVAMGFSSQDVIATVQSIVPAHFHKSMTAYADHRSWQDVYFVPTHAGVLYVKFTAHAVTGFMLLSFKEK